MSRQRQRDFVFVNTFAVIPNANQFLSTRDHIDLHCLCTRVQTVLDELFDDRRRAFDDLASGDLIDQVIRELLNRHTADYAGISAAGEDRDT